MEIKYFIGMIFIFSCSVANGQQPKMKIKVHVGISFFNIENFVGKNYRSGFTAGIGLIQPLSRSFNFQPELNFQQQGSQSTYTAALGDISGVKFHDRYTLNYLNIPFLFNWQLPWTSLNIYAGPQTGFLLSATLTHHPENYEPTKTDIKDNVNRFAFSGAYGISLALPAGKGNAVVLDGRFSKDFTRLNKGTRTDHGKNYGFTLTAGYSF